MIIPSSRLQRETKRRELKGRNREARSEGKENTVMFLLARFEIFNQRGDHRSGLDFFFSSLFEVKQGINVPTKTRVPEEAKVSRRKEVRNHRMKRVTALPDSRGRCLSPSMLQVGGDELDLTGNSKWS